MKVTIGSASVGNGEPCFIIAEAGVNHNGDIERAKQLVDTALEANADAVKFQTFKTEKMVTKYAEKAEYQSETTAKGESQYEMIKRLELTDNEFKELAGYAQKKGIMFLSSPFDEESVDLLERLGVPAFKIPSGEINNVCFLEYVAGKGVPVILSTGMATLGEVEDALHVLQGVDVVLLHCVTSYPASRDAVNLRVIDTLRHAFRVPVGFSDHTLGITTAVAAVVLGACVIEKHFTLDKTLPGPDHKASLAPDELKEMVLSIREVEKALGDGMKRPTEEEERIKKVVRKSIVAVTDIPEGTTITRDMVGIKRPGTGIEPRYLDLVIHRKVKTHIRAGEVLTFEDVW